MLLLLFGHRFSFSPAKVHSFIAMSCSSLVELEQDKIPARLAGKSSHKTLHRSNFCSLFLALSLFLFAKKKKMNFFPIVEFKAVAVSWSIIITVTSNNSQLSLELRMWLQKELSMIFRVRIELTACRRGGCTMVVWWEWEICRWTIKRREDNSSTSITIKHRMIFCLRPRTKARDNLVRLWNCRFDRKKLLLKFRSAMEFAITIDDCVMVGKS